MAAKRKSKVFDSAGPAARFGKNIVPFDTVGFDWQLRNTLDPAYGISDILCLSLDHPVGPATVSNPNPVMARWVENVTTSVTGTGAGVQTYTFKIGAVSNLATGSFFPAGGTIGNTPGELGGDYIFRILDDLGNPHSVKITNDGSASDHGGTGHWDLAACGIQYGDHAVSPGHVTIKTAATMPSCTLKQFEMIQGWTVDPNGFGQTFGFSTTLSSAGVYLDHGKKCVVVPKDSTHYVTTDTIFFDADKKAEKLQLAIFTSPGRHWKDNLTVDLCVETIFPDPTSGTIWQGMIAETDTDLMNDTVLYRFKHDTIQNHFGSVKPTFALTFRLTFDNAPKREVDTLLLGMAIGLKP